MNWFETVKSPKLKINKKMLNSLTPDGEWLKCSACQETIQTTTLKESLGVAPCCGKHQRLPAEERVEQIFDVDTVTLYHRELTTSDPLDFFDKLSYKERLRKSYEKTKKYDGTIVGTGAIDGRVVAFAIMDFSFMGGSMGVVTGEKIAIAFEIGLKQKLPVFVLSCSGGARMQEGILSLMQMGKICAIRQKLKNEGLPYISLLTDPTTGGVAASFSLLGDINLAEPNALIGFAGPRVIEQTIGQTLPVGFQKSEFLLEHGFIDRIVHRSDLKKELSFFFKFLAAN